MRHVFALTAAAALLLPLAAQAGFRASSHKEDRSARGANTWAASAALDSNPETAWMIDPEQDNAGSWFEVDVPKGTIDKLGMIIGWQLNDEVFNDYHRIQTLKVEIFDEASDDPYRPKLEHSITFQDQQDWQIIDLPDTEVGNEFSGGRVRLTVVDTFEGKDFPSLAVSELLVYMGEMDAIATLETPPSSAHPDHFPDAMLDGNARTYWSAGPDGAADAFTVGASGYGVSSIGITPGPRTHKRPKTLEITANNVTRTVSIAEDARTAQWFEVAPLSGYTGSGFDRVQVKITETWPGSSVDELAIAEVALRATNYSGI